jgi:NADH-quinone oxidoreductase subunit F
MSIESSDGIVREVKQLVHQIGGERYRLISLLQAIQGKYNYLPHEALECLCKNSEITPSQLAGVSTFYSQFRFKPVGEHLVRVCHGTACHVKGSGRLHDAIHRCLDIEEGDDTDAKRVFTVERVGCLGCCTLAPVVQIDDAVYGHLTPDSIPGVLETHLQWIKKRGKQQNRKEFPPADAKYGEIRIGLGSCCVAKGSSLLREAAEEELARIGSRALVRQVGCVGMCYQTPLLEVHLPGKSPIFYAQVGPEDARAIITRHFKTKGLINKVRSTFTGILDKVFEDDAWEPVSRYCMDVRDKPVAAFLGNQVHLATEHCGHLDPFDLDAYIKQDGFVALRKCLEQQSPEGIIDEVRDSGLRGRGGGGYPTVLKWEKVRQAKGEKKYIICNGDEGDPGAFMDRMLLESFPYRVIEGMIIAAYAVGANEGIFYVRAEYPLALRTLRDALKKCAERGFLGDNILGSGFALSIRIAEGAGAFVSGEETALLAALDGERSMPSMRPPYPAEVGLQQKPTLINNVETFALVPYILRESGESFSHLGTENSKGTKVFSLAGKVKRGGLIEVPMGITINEIVEGIGGGVADGGKFKAVQVGGPSGGCLPASLADTPVDYEALGEKGAIMGSGGLVVLDESDCMVDIARYFMEFTQSESCGKCTFCRIGTKRMLEILTKLCEGKAKASDLKQLEELADAVKQSSFCGLGKTAPNPVLTTLMYFREEYQAHLEGRCPAGKCQALITYSINDDCIGCTLCRQHCPVDAIPLTPYEKHSIDMEKCTRCDMCRSVCPENAVVVE